MTNGLALKFKATKSGKTFLCFKNIHGFLFLSRVGLSCEKNNILIFHCLFVKSDLREVLDIYQNVSAYKIEIAITQQQHLTLKKSRSHGALGV